MFCRDLAPSSPTDKLHKGTIKDNLMKFVKGVHIIYVGNLRHLIPKGMKGLTKCVVIS